MEPSPAARKHRTFLLAMLVVEETGEPEALLEVVRDEMADLWREMTPAEQDKETALLAERRERRS